MGPKPCIVQAGIASTGNMALLANIRGMVWLRFHRNKEYRKLMWEYLESKGYATEDIQSVTVYHSFLNVALLYHEWGIQVRYADEPGVIYIYTFKNRQIKEAGVSGNVDKKDLKHKEGL